MKTLTEASCHAQNQFDLSNRGIQDITGFAKPLLVAALKAAGHELDVDNTWLRLYYPVEYTFSAYPWALIRRVIAPARSLCYRRP